MPAPEHDHAGHQTAATSEITQFANGLVWKEPPPQRPHRTHRKLDVIEAELRANPGRWALIYDNASAGLCRPLKLRGLEVRTVRVSVGPVKHDVYARWPEVSDAV